MKSFESSIRSLTLVMCTLLTIAVFSAAANAQSERAVDETAIRASVQQMEDGWNTKSGALFAKPFAEDADYVVIDGFYLKGRAILDTAHQRIFDTVYKETTLKMTIKNIRYLRPDVAVVHVKSYKDAPRPELRNNALITLVMTKEKGGWSIAAFQNTEIQSHR